VLVQVHRWVAQTVHCESQPLLLVYEGDCGKLVVAICPDPPRRKWGWQMYVIYEIWYSKVLGIIVHVNLR